MTEAEQIAALTARVAQLEIELMTLRAALIEALTPVQQTDEELEMDLEFERK